MSINGETAKSGVPEDQEAVQARRVEAVLGFPSRKDETTPGAVQTGTCVPCISRETTPSSLLPRGKRETAEMHWFQVDLRTCGGDAQAVPHVCLVSALRVTLAREQRLAG